MRAGIKLRWAWVACVLAEATASAHEPWGSELGQSDAEQPERYQTLNKGRLPDLIPLTVGASTDTTTVGGQVSFHSIVQNPFIRPNDTTGFSAVDASATFYLGTPSQPVLKLSKTSPGVTIAAGNSHTLVIGWNVPSTFMPGNYGFYVFADADDTVAERDETNNVLIAATTLTLLPQPPGAVTAAQTTPKQERKVLVQFARSPSSGVARYIVHRGGVAIAKLPPCRASCAYVDTVEEDGTYEYSARAVAINQKAEFVSNASSSASVAVSAM